MDYEQALSSERVEGTALGRGRDAQSAAPEESGSGCTRPKRGPDLLFDWEIFRALFLDYCGISHGDRESRGVVEEVAVLDGMVKVGGTLRSGRVS